MVNKINKSGVKVLLVMGVFFLLVSLTSAYGASTPYWEDIPLKLAPGESTVFELTLQNMVGEDDVVFNAEITDDGDGIASLVNPDSIYNVPINVEDVKVPVSVVVPADIQQGGRREVVVSFKQVASGDGGMIGVSGGITTKFVVEIVSVEESVLFKPEQPLSEISVLAWVLFLVIVVIIVAILFVKKKKSK